MLHYCTNYTTECQVKLNEILITFTIGKKSKGSCSMALAFIAAKLRNYKSRIKTNIELQKKIEKAIDAIISSDAIIILYRLYRVFLIYAVFFFFIENRYAEARYACGRGNADHNARYRAAG